MDNGRQIQLQEAAVGLSVAMCQAIGDAAALAEAAKVAEAMFEDVNHFRCDLRMLVAVFNTRSTLVCTL
jgi:hypothetical protein